MLFSLDKKPASKIDRASRDRRNHAKLATAPCALPDTIDCDTHVEQCYSRNRWSRSAVNRSLALLTEGIIQMTVITSSVNDIKLCYGIFINLIYDLKF